MGLIEVFIAPTIFADVNADMRIVKEEIFGPVLIVQKFKDEEDAIQKRMIPFMD